MSKIGCICGKTIIDQSNNLSYKGNLIPDSSSDEIFNKRDELVDGLVEAIRTNKKTEWMKDQGLFPPYPNDVNPSGIINDLFYGFYLDKTKEIFQCESCGRILIQKGKTQQFIFFKPETEEWHDILDKLE